MGKDSDVSWLFRSHAPAAVLLIRLLVGGVFFEEGLQKFLFPELLGARPHLWALIVPHLDQRLCPPRAGEVFSHSPLV